MTTHMDIAMFGLIICDLNGSYFVGAVRDVLKCFSNRHLVNLEFSHAFTRYAICERT